MGLTRLAAIASAGALAASLVGAQPVRAPDEGLPPPPAMGPVVAAPPMADEATQSQPDEEVERPKAKPPEPTGPPRPERSPTAILRVLDKVTAETLRFEAPVGGPAVRYKSLVFQVRACETWGVRTPRPRSSAYLIINSDLGAIAGREVFRGWMFAEAPGVHALKHPVYDAWVESCAGTQERQSDEIRSPL
jgi:hypothetical protein